MSDTANDLPTTSPRLEGWKEIARYLKRDVSTVQRWEKQSGLPIHRHRHGGRGIPYAFPEELDRWWGLGSAPGSEGATGGPAGEQEDPSISRELASRLPRRPVAKTYWSVLVLFLVVSAAATAAIRWRTSRARPAVSLHLLPPDPDIRFRYPVVSPDGRRIAFVGQSSTAQTTIWVRELTEDSSRSVPDSDGAILPFWSPDGDAIGYFANGALRIVDLASRNTRVVAKSAVPGRGGAWSRRGMIVFAPTPDGGLYRVPASGGTPAQVTTLAPGEQSHRHPHFLPDGEHFVFSVWRGQERFALEIGSTRGGEARPVLEAFSQAYPLPGYLLLCDFGSLIAQPFDMKALRPTGPPRTIADHVAFDDMGQWAFSVSESGTLVYATERARTTEFAWVDRAGRRVRSLGRGGAFQGIALSHDGRRLATTRWDDASRTEDVWTLDTSTGAAERLTSDPEAADSALWSPDDSRIVFSSARNSTRGDLYVRPASSEGADEPLLLSAVGKAPQDWTAEGRLLFAQAPSGDLWEMALDGDRRPRRVLSVRQKSASQTGHEVQARLSPNRRMIAYSTNATGRWEIFLDVYPPSRQPLQVSRDGGDEPCWNQNGRELFYRAGRTVMAVRIGANAMRLASEPESLFTVSESDLFDFASTADGFILNVPTDRKPVSALTVVLNWNWR